ncbi:MAG: SCO family protein [Polaromonas sp.]
MFRTALLSASLALAGYGCAAWLTHDFQVWTAEGARRLEVALEPVAAPAVRIDGPGMGAQPLAQWLADGQSVTLVDFVYTRCQTVCLALGSVYQQMQAALQAASKPETPAATGKKGKVKLLSISFDGQHDSPQVLQQYALRLNADPQLWRFVRVQDPQETRRLLADFQVVVVPDGRGDFEHNAALLVLDQSGRLVRIFDYAEQQLALDYARALAGAVSP